MNLFDVLRQLTDEYEETYGLLIISGHYREEENLLSIFFMRAYLSGRENVK
jgi:hypothetical protein